jgi:hypothetical protein
MKGFSLIVLATIYLVSLGYGVSLASDKADWMEKAEEALKLAQSEIQLSPGDRNLLLLTNAGYGQVKTRSTEEFLDLAHEVTGCSLGARNLLSVHASVLDPLWFALYRKDSGKMVFVKWIGSGFASQPINVSPKTDHDTQGLARGSKRTHRAKSVFRGKHQPHMGRGSSMAAATCSHVS